MLRSLLEQIEATEPDYGPCGSLVEASRRLRRSDFDPSSEIPIRPAEKAGNREILRHGTADRVAAFAPEQIVGCHRPSSAVHIDGAIAPKLTTLRFDLEPALDSPQI
jgi:hypothetical protein